MKSQESQGAKSQSRGYSKTQQTAAEVFRALGKNSGRKKLEKKQEKADPKSYTSRILEIVGANYQ